jgi:phosphoenolpyruvate-protein kinase (PTS system EI component)
MSTHLRGAGGAPGIVLGRAVRYLPAPAAATAAVSDPEADLRRFAGAQASAAAHLRELAEQWRGEGRASEAGIFDAQALLVEDVYLSDEVTRRVREQHEPLELAIEATVAQMRAALESLDAPNLLERAADMDAIGRAIITSLRG